jgi:hypothetical protein
MDHPAESMRMTRDGPRAAHERDAAMAQFEEMDQSDFDSFVMVENDVGDVLDFAVSRNGDYGDRNFYLIGRRVQ